MNYDIAEIFGNLPAIATSFNETVEQKDRMIILETKPTSGRSKKKNIKFLSLIIDVLREDSPAHPLLLGCDIDSLPRRDIIHRKLRDGSIYSSYFETINPDVSLDSFVTENRKKLSNKANILCFPNSLLGFTYNYLFIVVFDHNILQRVRKIAAGYNYVNIGRNYSGLPTQGTNKFDDPYLDFFTPVSDSEFSYVKRLDKTTTKIVKCFNPVDYVLRSCNNRLLDEGYFIRVDLDYDKNFKHEAEEKSLLRILKLLAPNHQRMRVIYHGVIADSTEDNQLLVSGKLEQDGEIDFQLQSFLSPDEINVRDFLRGKFGRVLLDQTVFFNKDMIFSFYDSGADFRFFTKKDYERFFKSANKNHTIQMASYIPEGEHVAHLYPHRP